MSEPAEPPLLDKIRNMWEFAAITQFFYLFFDLFGLDDFDVEVFEEELTELKPPKLIPLARLRLVQGLSSNRTISAENLDDFTRKQYLKRRPNANPFGDEENPTTWDELDVFARIRVMQHLCTWQLDNPERFRERANVKDSEQLDWRVDPVGYDADGNTYYLFDDNRLYYRDAPIVPEEKPSRKKYRGKKRKRGARRVVESDDESTPETNGVDDNNEESTWHVQCIDIDDYNPFLSKLRKSRDLDEKALYRHLNENVLPMVVEEEAERARKRELREQEFLREQAYLARKRSTRLIQKEEDKKHEEEREYESAKIKEEEAAREKEKQRLKKLEQEREARLALREQRLREREERIALREDEKRRAAEEAERLGNITITVKMSESPSPAKKTARQQALEEMSAVSKPSVTPQPQAEESWFFDCICGQHGTNYDDGTFTVACEKCDIWQHVDCLRDERDKAELYKRKDAEEGTYEDYEFICTLCKKKAKEVVKAETSKSKEERDRAKKEREKEVNRAKYERRKIREKAKKEEERKKREEEARLAMQNAGVASAAPLPPPSGEVRIPGPPPSVAPLPAPERAPMSTGQMSAMPRYTPPSQHPAPNASPSTPYVQHAIPPQHPAPGQYAQPLPPHPSPHRPMQPIPQSMPIPGHYHPPPSQQPPPQQPRPPQLPVSQQPRPLQQAPPPPPRPSQYQPLRPAVTPYFSQYTTNATLPNGQTFSEIRPAPGPYSNGIAPMTLQTRGPQPKPSPVPLQFRPLLPQGQMMYTHPQQQHQSSHQPAPIQPRASTSPEIRRSPGPVQPPQHTPPSIQPRPSVSPEMKWSQLPPQPDRPLQGPNYSPNHQFRPNSPSETKSLSQSRSPQNFGHSIRPIQPERSFSPPTELPVVHSAPPAQSTFNQQQGLTQSPRLPAYENGSTDYTPLPRIVPSTESVNGTEKIENRSPSALIVNGVKEDKGQGAGSSDLAKESERTKMSFLLN